MSHGDMLASATAALDPSTELVKDCRHGAFFVLRHDRYISRALREFGEWSEPEIQEVYKHYVSEGAVVLDVGSNIGAFTVPLAKMAGVTGVVHAFEPLRTVHHLMTANAVLNGCLNIRAHQAFVGEAGEKKLKGAPHINYMVPNNYGSLQWTQNSLDQRAGTHWVDLVPMLAIDDLELWGAALIKIDVEGHELGVLRGARRTIEKYKPAVYLEAEERNAGTAKTLRFLRTKLSYLCFQHKVPLYNPNNWRKGVAWLPSSNQGEDILTIASWNALCVHKDDVRGLPPAFRGAPPIEVSRDRDEL